MKEETKASAKESHEDNNMDKIRDILFGNNINEIDKRFNKLEQGLQETITSLKEDMQKKLHSFDDYYKSEISTLLGQLKTEQKNRLEAEKQLTAEIAKVKASVGELQEELQNSSRELRNKLMDQYKEITENLSSVEKEVKRQINKEVNTLTDSKMDRKTLAIMLSEMALKIGEESAE